MNLPAPETSTLPESVKIFLNDLRLSNRINEKLGLKQIRLDYYNLDGTKSSNACSRFQREPSGGIPALEIVVDRSGSHYDVSVNARGDLRYHRETGCPLEEGEVIGQISGYLTELKGSEYQ